MTIPAIPKKTDVLVVGGGPAGSYAASILAREGIDTVVLEGEKFPRYHVGESMLPSMRYFLRFIDLESKFEDYGFRIKKGAAFKLNERKATYTDFIAAYGSNGYSWNVTRSECDNLIFEHAKECGAKTFDGCKVHSLAFLSRDGKAVPPDFDVANPTKPVSAAWSHKDGSSGEISFDYLVDASGRFGLMSNKYLKNRHFNQGLKNVAFWAYWKGTGIYGNGTHEGGCPYFEHLQDASGWVWFIPLHNGTTSVGIVMDRDAASNKRKVMASSSIETFYLSTLKNQCGDIRKLLTGAELADYNFHTASDWSYNASVYASPNVRIAGDAGCFVDPFFSSGVHIALASGLSAAATIAASRRGDCEELVAANWHTSRVRKVYRRFLAVVSAATAQIRAGDMNLLGKIEESGFQTAFANFRPIIQGTADVATELGHDRSSSAQKSFRSTADIAGQADQPSQLETINAAISDEADRKNSPMQDHTDVGQTLSTKEPQVPTMVRARQEFRHADLLKLIDLSSDVIDGLMINLKERDLGLRKVEHENEEVNQDVMSSLPRGKL